MSAVEAARLLQTSANKTRKALCLRGVADPTVIGAALAGVRVPDPLVTLEIDIAIWSNLGLRGGTIREGRGQRTNVYDTHIFDAIATGADRVVTESLLKRDFTEQRSCVGRSSACSSGAMG